MCRVERRTLHYYDEIGLLKPMEIEGNGYRVYAPHQIDTMGMIKALQAVGMPLSEIKKLMKEENLSVSMPLLHKQIQLIREKQEELRIAENMLTHATNQLEDYLVRGDDVFFTEYCEDIPIVIQALDEERISYINYITYGYQYGVIMKEKDSTSLACMFRMATAKEESNAVKLGGNYACIYQRAQNGKLREIILSFIKFLEQNKIQTVGSLYLDNIATDFIKLPGEEYLFKLSIKCRN
jgi:DNA-binding transcriptional MerR regulator